MNDESNAHLYLFLAENALPYERFDHPPAYTVADLESFGIDWHGTGTKNLFLRNEKGTQHFLLVVEKDKPVDLKQLGKTLGLGRLGFASPERMLTHLKITPGAVSFLAALNDSAQGVQFLLDQDLQGAAHLHAHPLVNTTTLVMALADVERFLHLTGHAPRYVEVPARAE